MSKKNNTSAKVFWVVTAMLLVCVNFCVDPICQVANDIQLIRLDTIPIPGSITGVFSGYRIVLGGSGFNHRLVGAAQKFFCFVGFKVDRCWILAELLV